MVRKEKRNPYSWYEFYRKWNEPININIQEKLYKNLIIMHKDKPKYKICVQ